MKCFLSRSFRPEDKEVADWFRAFLQAFPYMTIVEASDDPRPPIEQVTEMISTCHSLCAVATSRNGAVPQWVSTEVGMAKSLGKIVFAFVEEGINDLGCIGAITAFQSFRRDTLWCKVPDYIRYVFATRSRVLDSLGYTRSELLQRLEKLTAVVQLLEAARDRVDEI
jgi:hypothetical protein